MPISDPSEIERIIFQYGPFTCHIRLGANTISLALLQLDLIFHHFTYLPFHSLIVAPIYYRGMDLICITLSGVGLPAVILNLVRDDLRMMAPKPVAAKDGAMKDYEDGCCCIWRM
jgi:hypothetical protein